MSERGESTDGPSTLGRLPTRPYRDDTAAPDTTTDSRRPTGQATAGRVAAGHGRTIVEACRAELAKAPEPARQARLHYNIARELERDGHAADALDHYGKALAASPTHLPSMRAARRFALGVGDYSQVLSLFDAEIELTPDPRARAMLHYARARVLEDAVGDLEGARASYQKALTLDGENAAVLKALERIDSDAGRWADRAEWLRRSAGAVTKDARHRAAIVSAQAQLVERLGRDDDAIDLYEGALKLDPGHPGAETALERLHHRRRDWREVAEGFERRAKSTGDPELAAVYLRRAAHIEAEHLASLADAVNALASAMSLVPGHPLVLDELAPLYQSHERILSLAEVLHQQISTTRDTGERTALLHSLGHIYELLAHDDQAVRCYEDAIEADATHALSIRALDRLYSRYGRWNALLRVVTTEAEYSDDAERGAAAHIRAAELVELHQGDLDAATAHYERALARMPAHPIAIKALARLYRQKGRWRELVELYERGAQLARDTALSVGFLMQAAMVWEDALGEPNRASAVYERIIAIEPANVAAIHGLQRTLERAHRFRDLARALELELALTTTVSMRIELHHRIGSVLLDELDDPDAAIQHFRDILDADPTHSPTLVSLGRIYRTSGRWEELLDIYERELIRVSDGRRAAVLLYRMGELCQRCLGDDQRAIEHYRRAGEQDPSYRPPMRALADALRAQQNWPALAEALEHEAESSSDPELRALGWYRAAEVYEVHLDDPDRAAHAYELSLATVPGFRPALAALARLRHERREWIDLLGELALEIDVTSDAERKIALELQRGAIYRDELGDPAAAIACFESVLHDEHGRRPALLALERLYPLAGDFDKLAATYQALADVTTDRNAQVAALREMARVMETRGVGTREQLLGVYERLLALVPGDLLALERLEDMAAGDPALAERVYHALVEATSEPQLRAHYLTQLGLALETQKDVRAMAIYRRAIADHREQLAAVRGLARVADSINDSLGLADAARIEAEQTSGPGDAAELYTRSARLRLSSDLDGGIADLRRALELAPETDEAARALTRALSSAGRHHELVVDLTGAARACTDTQRAALLWLQVATLQADDLGRHAAGISSLQRGLEAMPAHVPSLRKLAELHQHEHQWRDAVNALERVLAATRERDVFCATQLDLATLWEEHLGEPERARACVDVVLERHPRHQGALSRRASYLAREGKTDEAAEVVRQLIAELKDPVPRAHALVRLAELEIEGGNEAAAEDALRQALELEGPGGKADEAYRRRAETQHSWVGYAAGLAAYLQSAPSDKPTPAVRTRLVAGHLELARTYDVGMGLPNKAIETLEDALASAGGASPLYLDLATRLRRAGRYADAMQRTKELLASEPANDDGWLLVAGLFEDLGLPAEARYVQHPLAVLDPQRHGLPRGRAKSLSNPISLDVVHALSPEHASSHAAATLLAATADAVGRLFPPELERYGLSRRDRVSTRSGHPLRDAADRIAEIFTAPEFDFYVHDGRAPLLSIELTEPVSIVVSRAAARLSGAQKAFLLSYAMSAIAARFHTALRLTARELELLLAASARAVAENTSSPHSGDARLSEHAQIIKKAVPRRWRRTFDMAGAEYARSRINVTRWQQSLLHTAIRSALIVCDDLDSGLAVLRRMHGMPDLRGRELVESSRTVSDLMHFWISDDAFRARRSCGFIVDTPTPVPPVTGSHRTGGS